MTGLETILADLECVMQELSDRVEVLTDAVDALRTEIEWRNNQSRGAGETPEPFVLRSMPLDPCAADWQINRVGRDGRPQVVTPGPKPGAKGTLFE